MNQLQSTDQQLSAVNDFFSELASYGRRLTYVEAEELVA
jgi:tRNA-dihydrouridine synthase B